MRMHGRRLSRLADAFSKNPENFKAAIALHYANCNPVKTHRTMRRTRTLEASVSNASWTVGDIVEMIDA